MRRRRRRSIGERRCRACPSRCVSANSKAVEFNRDRGFGITVYVGKRKGSASTSDTTPEAVAATVQAACNIARFTEEDPCHGLADAALMARVLPELDLDHPWTPAVADAEACAREAESAAREYDRRITNSDGASVGTQRGCRVYGNRTDSSAPYRNTPQHQLRRHRGGRKGKQREHYYSIARRDGRSRGGPTGRRRSRTPRGIPSRRTQSQDGTLSRCCSPRRSRAG